MATKEEAVIKAVEAGKRSQFKLTALKVELEIVFYRGFQNIPSYDCSNCEDGITPGGTYCSKCYSKLRWDDMRSINDHILKQLVPLGLAKKCQIGEYRYGYQYRPIPPLVFAKTYHDITVDTEFTFTIMLTDPQTVLKLPKIIEAFYSLKQYTDREPSISDAGMHMSLINDPDGVYPNLENDKIRLKNFRKSMILLLPTLFFLGATTKETRIMRYRKPDIASRHYAAINYSGGALEFRVFDPCFNDPEKALDNVVVMCNTLKFWTKRYTRNHLAKITKECYFGNDNGPELQRLFVTAQHIDLLNRGLRLIKPSYKTITELKRERGFTITKAVVRDGYKRALEEAKKEYAEYEKRFGWELVMQKNNYICRYLQERITYHPSSLPDVGTGELMKEAEENAKAQLKEYEAHKRDRESYLDACVARALKVGDYKLCVE